MDLPWAMWGSQQRQICGQSLQVVSENGLSDFAELLRKSCVARIFSLALISVIVAVEVSSITPFGKKPVETVAIGTATVEMVSQSVRGSV